MASHVLENKKTLGSPFQSAIASEATPELREKLHRRLQRIEGVNLPLEDPVLGSKDRQRARSRKGQNHDAQQASDDSSCSESSNDEDEPLDYFMLSLATKLAEDEATELMQRISRQQQRHARLENRLRKQLQTS